jgi:aminopeptidase YwaD
MKRIFYCLLLTTHFATAQKLKKADKAIVTNLQTHINYLADDKLEGRRTGSNGEKLAYEYISNEFLKAGLLAHGDKGTFLQEFEVNDGKMVSKASFLIVNSNDLIIDKDYFPLPFCKNSSLTTTASIALQENGTPWFYDIKELLEANKNNPHFDLTDAIKTKAADAAKKTAIAFFVYNSSAIKDELQFDPKAKSDLSPIPVIYITKTAREKYLKDETATLDIQLKIDVVDKKRYGHNVIGYLDNNVTNTIIIGAHYDHLGYGEDHNSLYTGNAPQIHNGADDNTSGTAAVIELAKLLKASKYKNNNYLFICFSGEELGLFGSKYFTDHPTVDIASVNYMVNLDMVGRLNDSTHGLNIGGYGTSPVWGETLLATDKFFKIKFDSSGTGPSDHTSFYRKDIPVLFFFTGVHSDYHKPSDDADKINYTGEWMVLKYIYKLIEDTNKKGRLAFTKTREVASSGKSSFKVTLGIMPDYTFSGIGVRADGVSEGKIAQKAGIKTGDVIVQLGDYKFTDVQTYMETLNKFNKGDATKIKVKRGKEELVFDIVF